MCIERHAYYVLNSLVFFLPGVVPKNPYIGCQFEGGAVRSPHRGLENCRK